MTQISVEFRSRLAGGLLSAFSHEVRLSWGTMWEVVSSKTKKRHVRNELKDSFKFNVANSAPG